ncbi:hypothetical protein TPAU25S_01366 [Tsukamurella paurometabola]
MSGTAATPPTTAMATPGMGEASMRAGSPRPAAAAPSRSRLGSGPITAPTSLKDSPVRNVPMMRFTHAGAHTTNGITSAPPMAYSRRMSPEKTRACSTPAAPRPIMRNTSGFHGATERRRAPSAMRYSEMPKSSEKIGTNRAWTV